jgi:two-component system sensor histidine kinase BarA
MDSILDKQQALEKAGGQASLAKELFGMLLKELPDLKQLMIDAYHANSDKDFWDHVHKIHGSTAYCGVPALRASSKALEDAIKSGQTFEEMHAGMNQLQQAIEDVLDIGPAELESDW